MQPKIRSITAKSLSVFIAIILISSVAIPIFGYAKPALAQTPPTWSNLTPSTSPSPRMLPSMVYDKADGYLLLFGGYGCGGVCGDTWKFSNGVWTQLAESNSPSPRAGASIVYDAADGYVLLFGGSNVNGEQYGSALGDTWKFSNGVWTRLSTPSGLDARVEASIAYDASDGYVLLFGGWDGQNIFGDAWKFNGGTWTPLTATPPHSRAGGGMVYDESQGYILLFGGTANPYSSADGLADTWKYQGGAWTQLLPATAPGDRNSFGFTYDNSIGEPILFAGWNPAGGCGADVDDTWEFNGINWIQLNPTTSPSGRQSEGLVYDPQIQEDVMFGGVVNSGADYVGCGTPIFQGDTWTFGSGSSSSGSSSTLEILNYESPSSVPVMKEPLTFTVNMQNNGPNAIQQTDLQYIALYPIATYPSLDSQGFNPSFTCSDSSYYGDLQPGGKFYMTFTCTPDWKFAKPPNFFQTVTGTFTNLLIQAISDGVSLGVGTVVDHILTGPELQAFDQAFYQAQSAIGVPAAAQGAIAGVAELFAEGNLTPGVTYDLKVLSKTNDIQIQQPEQTLEIIATASQDKLDESTQYVSAVSISEAVSAGAFAAGSATLFVCATVIACPVAAPVAGLFYAIGALAGPVTEAVYQHGMSDPSLNYTQFVQVPPVSNYITSLQNNGSAGKSLYYLSLYVNYLNASSQSSDRAAGALSQNSTSYAYLQGAKAMQYASYASMYYNQFQNYFNQTLQQIKSSEIINQTTFQIGQTYVEQNGLPQSTAQILTDLGLSGDLNMTQINKMTYTPVNFTLLSSIPNQGYSLVQDQNLFLKHLEKFTISGSPTVSISSPSSNSFSNHNIINARGITNDPSGIQKVSVSIDGSQSYPATLNFGAYSNSTVTWAYTTPPLLDGSHVLIANSTSNGGKSSLDSVLVTVDTIPPEAYLAFNSTTKDLVLYGNDTLSGVPNNPIIPTSVVSAKWGDDDNKLDNDTDKGDAQIRTYNIADRAGNTLTLTEKIRTNGHEDKVRILSLQYNGGKVISTLPNEEKFNWSENKDHTIKELEQHITIGKDKQDVDAKYSLKDNKTIIHVEIPSKHNNEIKETGLVLLHIASNNGTFIVNGY